MSETVYKKALKIHEELQGKISIELKKDIRNLEDLSLLYSPGVAAPCLAIEKNPKIAYEYTMKGNTVAVVTDGSAVLGLGNIGGLASLPVMEGKAALLKKFANVNAIPIVLDTQDPDEIVMITKAIAPNYGAILLEDIASPKCIDIENKLAKDLNIPVFHDDQHGTAIVTLAGLINALKLAEKNIEDVKIVVNGVGAAGSAIILLLREMGAENILAFNSKGIIDVEKYYDSAVVTKLQAHLQTPRKDMTLEDAFEDADVFIGVSVKDVVTPKMISLMNDKSIVFALANPDPEIQYDKAKEAGAFIVATGRSDYPNQINNVLAFPGIFKGLLKARAEFVGDDIKVVAAKAIANTVIEISEDEIVPSSFDEKVMDNVSEAVYEAVLKKKE